MHLPIKKPSLITLFCIALLGTPASYAEADGPDYWAVTDVSHGSALNLRRGPNTGFRVIKRIPWNAVKLENRGCVPNLNFAEYSALNQSEQKLLGRISWCRVAYKNQQGWVAARYLRESNVH